MDQDGNQVGVVSLRDALDRAEAVYLDLVEIAPNAEPPVCRIMDYGKYLFEINKKKAAQKRNKNKLRLKKLSFVQPPM